MKSCLLALGLDLRCGRGWGFCAQRKESKQPGALDLSSALTLCATLSKLPSRLQLCHVNSENNDLSA